MRRSLWLKRRHDLGDGKRLLGALLIATGAIILWQLMPVWLFYGLVAALLICFGLLLVNG